MKIETFIKINTFMSYMALVASAIAMAAAFFCFFKGLLFLGLFNAFLSWFNFTNHKNLETYSNEAKELLNEKLRDGHKDL